MMKSSGPKAEPWGTPQREVCEEDRLPAQLTRKERDDRYDSNQSRTMPCIPNEEDRRFCTLSWQSLLIMTVTMVSEDESRNQILCESVSTTCSRQACCSNVCSIARTRCTYGLTGNTGLWTLVLHTILTVITDHVWKDGVWRRVQKPVFCVSP